MRVSEGYRSALTAVLRSTAAAYGYSLTIASTVATLSETHGRPGVGQLYLFIAGGIGAFAVLEGVLVVAPAGDEAEAGHAFPLAGVLNVIAAGVAFGVAALLAHAIAGGVAWLLTPLAATVAYLALSAGQATAVDLLQRRGHGDH